jgi:hypothetical protein
MSWDFTENSVIASLPFGIGIVLLAAQAWFARRFVQLAQLTQLTRRVEVLEQNAHAPDHEDVIEIERRIGTVEATVAELRADIRGVRDGIARVEHMVTLLVEHGLRREGHHAQ